ncbi:MAG: cell division protein FtsA, partial [Chloroflexota bacterium]
AREVYLIEEPVAAAIGAGLPVQETRGSMIIDIGGGTTDMAIYVDGTVWHTAVIAIGGDHVTNDISYLLNAPIELAEDVKIKHGHANQRAVNELESFLVEPFGDGIPQEIARRDLAMVVEARIEEMFELVRKEIKRSGYDGLLRAGAVITGGSSQIAGMKEVASRVLDSPVRMAKPEKLTGISESLRNPSYSTSVGLLRMGLEVEGAYYDDAPSNNGSMPGNGIGQMIGDFLRRLLPDDRDM